ncbi:beta-ketoacyl synthase N-terminal-like domain-containing protein [Streptomyces sp. WMMB303]|uniref:beta-ketoacyl synthase N-terminal-like domain-containing protein n=1 Tax=Streptomyces sp. WMMB303 TaxID=3034154 RepID=UPI0023EC8A37|nr:beta-ketoacyl synthase N-terminal-like domain-containing protein [Streptomyces sp. WMMB303]MDF4251732.1 beta-ketoacyl synthase N-terminal-like domain-containing protein [Streptomyces sp. WMMB303]
MIGAAFRLPGADGGAQLWRDMYEGVSHVRRFTDTELSAAGLPERVRAAADFVAAGAPLTGIEDFDAAFFGMSAKEAAVTDPQQRLLLECCHHALEDAGYGDPARTAERIGVYATTGYRLHSLHSYLDHNLAAEREGADWVALKSLQVGNYPDFAAARVAFRLGLTGPTAGLATACSGSLVSVHLACQALRAGEAGMMLAGSAALHLPQATGHRHMRGSTLSPTGAVRPFDADADGTIGGSGTVAVLLKPLERALADGDTVHTVILGSAVTNDGADKRSFAAPSVSGQRDAVLLALERAGVRPETIGYLESHGTGTLKGDPLEFAALSEAFRAHSRARGHCALGSAKPAVGHLDSCAGLAGLVRATLALRHGTVPPLVNHQRPNPALGALADSPFLLPRSPLPWPVDDGPRRAGVHSIGMGGTNAHLILQEPPPRRRTHASRGRGGHTPTSDAHTRSVPASGLPASGDPAAVPLLPLSARTGPALADAARALRDRLSAGHAPPWEDLVTTLALGRRHFAHRLILTAGPGAPPSPAALVAQLDDWLAHEHHGHREDRRARARPTEGPGFRTAFVFDRGRAGARADEHAGLPAGVARGLYERFPVVRETVDALTRPYPGLAALLLAAEAPADRRRALAEPALFVLQTAQHALWERVGIRPCRVTGHGAGRWAASCTSGARAPREALRMLMEGRDRPAMPLPESGMAAPAPRSVPGADAVVVLGPAPSAEPADPCRAAGPADRAPGPGEAPAGFWHAVGTLYLAGAELDWDALLDGHQGGRVPLPGYPFQRTRHWKGPPPLPRTEARPRTGTSAARPHNRTEDTLTDHAILDRVTKLTADHLDHSPEQLDPDRGFVALGADSLQLIGLVRQLEGEFGVELDLTELLDDAGTPRLAAEMIAERSLARPGPELAREPRRESGGTPHQEPHQEPCQEPRQEPRPGPGPDRQEPVTRAELDELARQVGVLAETQQRMLTQLADAVALLTDGRGAVTR